MTRTRTAARLALVALPAALVPAVLSAAPASASGGDAVRAAGRCSAASSWALKARHDDGRIEVELEVDSDRVGQSWSWRLLDDGVRVASGSATTTAPSGSFTVSRRIADPAGSDIVRFRSSNAATGETCTGAVTV